jgi:hypothetical protein
MGRDACRWCHPQARATSGVGAHTGGDALWVVTSIRLTHPVRRHRLPHRPGAQHKIPALTTSPDSLEIHRAFSPSRHDLSLPPAVVVNEASDVTFPGRIAPAFKARVSPPDQSGRGTGHRLPCRVGASTRLPLRSTQILSGSPVLTARSKVKLPVCSVPLTCHRAFTLVAVLSSTPRRLCCPDHSLVETRGSTSGDGCVGCGVVVGDPELIG